MLFLKVIYALPDRGPQPIDTNTAAPTPPIPPNVAPTMTATGTTNVSATSPQICRASGRSAPNVRDAQAAPPAAKAPSSTPARMIP